MHKIFNALDVIPIVDLNPDPSVVMDLALQVPEAIIKVNSSYEKLAIHIDKFEYNMVDQQATKQTMEVLVKNLAI